MEVNHIHIKLYPVYKVNANIKPNAIELLARDVRENWYNGYIVTLHGDRAREEELEEVSEKVRIYLEDKNI